MTYITASMLLVLVLFPLAHPLKKTQQSFYCEGDGPQAVEPPRLETSKT